MANQHRQIPKRDDEDHPESINVARIPSRFAPRKSKKQTLLRALIHPRLLAMKKYLLMILTKGHLVYRPVSNMRKDFILTRSEVIELAKAAASAGGRYYQST